MKTQLSIDEQVVINIFNKYLLAQEKIIKSKPRKNNQLAEKGVSYCHNGDDFNLAHINNVDTVLALLPRPEYTCLIKNYMVIKNKNWWKKTYTKAEYQRLCKKAIHRFLYLYLI